MEQMVRPGLTSFRLSQYTARWPKRPDETETVTLADHTVESEHKPHLDIFKNGKLIGRITFPVSVEIELKGLMLEIDSGKVRKIASGEDV
jgi:hypothetical protein